METPQLTHWRFKMATIEVGAKVIFNENGPLYIFAALLVKLKVFAICKRRMVSNVRISLITVSTKKRLETTTT